MSQYNHCDAFVSSNFVRVFDDEDGNVYAYPSCSANTGISQVSSERRASSL